MGIDAKLIDELLKDYQSPEQITGENGLLKQLTKGMCCNGGWTPSGRVVK